MTREMERKENDAPPFKPLYSSLSPRINQAPGHVASSPWSWSLPPLPSLLASLLPSATTTHPQHLKGGENITEGFNQIQSREMRDGAEREVGVSTREAYTDFIFTERSMSYVLQ